MPERFIRIVAISGSLRRLSSNGALVEAASALAPAGVEVSIFRGLAELPPFNPDLDHEEPAGPLRDWRRQLELADAVLISSPEYAHGVPGVLKNALDWLVGSGELVGKPVALVNASPRATHAWTSLVDTLTVMSARVIVAASVAISLQGRALDAAGIAADPGLAVPLRTALDALVSAAREAQAKRPVTGADFDLS